MCHHLSLLWSICFLVVDPGRHPASYSSYIWFLQQQWSISWFAWSGATLLLFPARPTHCADAYVHYASIRLKKKITYKHLDLLYKKSNKGNDFSIIVETDLLNLPTSVKVFWGCRLYGFVYCPAHVHLSLKQIRASAIVVKLGSGTRLMPSSTDCRCLLDV